MAILESTEIKSVSDMLLKIAQADESIKELLARDPDEELSVGKTIGGVRYQLERVTMREMLAVLRERRLILAEKVREIGIEVGQ